MNKKGFTLIELLIVVTIIGILAVALVPRIVGGSASARDARRQTDLQSIATGLEYYLSENGTFDLGSAGDILSPSDLEVSLSGFIGAIPTDPVGDDEYVVILLEDSGGTLTKYAIVAVLEVAGDGDDFVYTAIPADTDYTGFVGSLDPFGDPASDTAYFIIY